MVEELDALGTWWQRRIQILGELVSQAKEFRLYHLDECSSICVSPVSGSWIVSRLHHLISILNEYIRIENVRAFHVKRVSLEVDQLFQLYLSTLLYTCMCTGFSSLLFSLSAAPAACGTPVPQPGVEPGSWQWKCGVLPLDHQGLYGIFLQHTHPYQTGLKATAAIVGKPLKHLKLGQDQLLHFKKCHGFSKNGLKGQGYLGLGLKKSDKRQ